MLRLCFIFWQWFNVNKQRELFYHIWITWDVQRMQCSSLYAVQNPVDVMSYPCVNTWNPLHSTSWWTKAYHSNYLPCSFETYDTFTGGPCCHQWRPRVSPTTIFILFSTDAKLKGTIERSDLFIDVFTFFRIKYVKLNML